MVFWVGRCEGVNFLAGIQNLSPSFMSGTISKVPGGGWVVVAGGCVDCGG